MEIQELAENWIWTRLGEISRISDRDHRTPKYVKNGYPLISPINFTPFGIDFSKIKFVEEDEFLQFKRKCNPNWGDILYSRIGTIGEARLVDFRNDFVALHSISVIKPKHEIISSKFLLYLLNSNFIRRQAFASIRSIGTPDLGLDRISNFKVPLPPLETQSQIVAILDKAEETKRLRAQADEMATRLIQSLFFDMFGNIEENSMEWKKAKIGDVVKESRYGLSKKANENGTYPILGMNNITYDGNLDFYHLNYIDLDLKEYNKYKLEKGDILFNRTNAANLVGKTAIFKEIIPFVYASYLIKLELNSKLIAPEFFWVYLNLPMTKKKLSNRSKKAVNQANINAQELNKFDILLPPIEIQQRFCDIMQRIQDIAPSQKKSREMINQLFISLMQKAFTGELVA